MPLTDGPECHFWQAFAFLHTIIALQRETELSEKENR